jgi:propionyl-CoA synthetase
VSLFGECLHSLFLDLGLHSGSDNYWQTETGFPIVAPCLSCDPAVPSTPVRPGSAGMPVAGTDIRVIALQESQQFDEHATTNDTSQLQECMPGETGNLAVKLPLPPGVFTTLWNNHDGYKRSYFDKFPGYFDLTDAGFIDGDGYVHVMSRTDDVMNTAGHRLSTGSIEEIVDAHESVAECAVVGHVHGVKGEVPVAFVVLKHMDGATLLHDKITHDLVQSVRRQLGAFACFERVLFVDRLPKTRSGKVLRRILRSMVNGQPYTVPATIEDESVLQEIKDIVLKT